MGAKSDACVAVGQGSVGESGASSILCHTVSGTTSKVIVVRQTGSSLCPNTGAVATLLVNGVPVATESISAAGSMLQTDANPGDKITVVVHTVPLFNGVLCVRLGDLSFRLDECELVMLNDSSNRQPGMGACVTPPTRDWYAWNDLMPPKPDVFHVNGEAEVSNPGVVAVLVPRNPQGISSEILLLDLHLVQRPGVWPRIIVWAQARYEKVNAHYSGVEIFSCGNSIKSIDVIDAQ